MKIHLTLLALVWFAHTADAQSERIYVNPGDGSTNLGWSLAGGEDFDGDGTPDFVAGAPNHGDPVADIGVVRFHSGVDGSLIDELTFATPSGRAGVVLTLTGDVDLDGTRDVAILAECFGTAPAGTHQVQLYSGATRNLLWSSPTFGVLAIQDDSHTPLAGIHDVDGDGRGDLLVGRPGAGSAMALSGLDGTPILGFDPVATLPASDLGYAVCSVPNLDGSPEPDLLLGAPRAESSAASTDQGAVLIRSGLDGSAVRIDYGPTAGGAFGTFVIGVADVNGDGFADYCAGAPNDSTTMFQAGAAHMVSGATGAILWSFHGSQVEEHLGTRGVALADYDGDGLPDVLVGAPDKGVCGYSYILRGVDGAVLQTHGGPSGSPGGGPSGCYGGAATSMGDFTGDGREDIAMSSSSGGQVILYEGCRATGIVYCETNPNSWGQRATMEACVVEPYVMLRSARMPSSQFGFFLMGQNAGNTPLFDGVLCLDSPIVRLNVEWGSVINSGVTRQIVRDVYLPTLPQGVVLQPGSTWRFQAWFRDNTVNGSNFSDAVALTL